MMLLKSHLDPDRRVGNGIDDLQTCRLSNFHCHIHIGPIWKMNSRVVHSVVVLDDSERH